MPNTAGISGLELRQSLAGTGGLTAIAVALLQIDALTGKKKDCPSKINLK